MLKFAMAVMAATLFVAPCFAQTADNGSTEAVQSAPIDPARLAAARRVVAANGSARSLGFVIERMVPVIMAPIARAEGLNQTQTQVATQLGR